MKPVWIWQKWELRTFAGTNVGTYVHESSVDFQNGFFWSSKNLTKKSAHIEICYDSNHVYCIQILRNFESIFWWNLDLSLRQSSHHVYIHNLPASHKPNNKFEDSEQKPFELNWQGPTWQIERYVTICARFGAKNVPNQSTMNLRNIFLGF
jgi:hypothetical protein